MQEKWQIATSFMASHPGLELRLTGRKCAAFWTGVESPLKTFRETDSILGKGNIVVQLSYGHRSVRRDRNLVAEA